MKLSLAITLMLVSTIVSAQSFRTSNPDSLKINSSDIVNFWSAYDKLATAKSNEDSTLIIEQNYLQIGTYGLKQYQEASHSNAGSFLQAIRTHPQLLKSMRLTTLSIPTYRNRIINGAKKLKQIYPGSVFPEIFFVIGKFEVGGSKFENFLYVGAELLGLAKDSPLDELNPHARSGINTVDKLDVICLHEMVHYQQKLSPKTNMEQALIEGGAEFIANKLTGKSTMQPVFDQIDAKKEKVIWHEFAQHMNDPMEAKWFLATGDQKLKRPGMLGYLIGFRICEAYHDKAKNKSQALKDIIMLTNPQKLYQQSNYGK